VLVEEPIFEIRSCRDGEYEDDCLLGGDVMWAGRCVPVFQMNLLASSSGYMV